MALHKCEIKQGIRVRRISALDRLKKKFIGCIGTILWRDYYNKQTGTIHVLYDSEGINNNYLDYGCDPNEFERVVTIKIRPE